jgi:hypothetical protein
MSLALLLALLGAVALAAGAALLLPAAGLIVAGVELLAAAYVVRYLEAQRATP